MTEKKAKTSLEISQKNADQIQHTPPEGRTERKEFEIENFVVVPQEKLNSHVVNQDDAIGFDIDKKSGKFKDDKQSMSRIKNVFADGHKVVIQIDKSKTDFSIHAAVLTDQRLTPRAAVERALMLNDLLRLDKVNLADRKMVEEIVEATIIAVLQARENKMKDEGATYEDIKKTRRKMLERIHQFEAAVKNKRGQVELDQLNEMVMFKKVLEKIAK
jgi:hypothetical protein